MIFPEMPRPYAPNVPPSGSRCPNDLLKVVARRALIQETCKTHPKEDAALAKSSRFRAIAAMLSSPRVPRMRSSARASWGTTSATQWRPLVLKAPANYVGGGFRKQLFCRFRTGMARSPEQSLIARMGMT